MSQSIMLAYAGSSMFVSLMSAGKHLKTREAHAGTYAVKLYLCTIDRECVRVRAHEL